MSTAALCGVDNDGGKEGPEEVNADRDAIDKGGQLESRLVHSHLLDINHLLAVSPTDNTLQERKKQRIQSLTRKEEQNKKKLD